jgi:ribosome-associated translation inhibitor RaiA
LSEHLFVMINSRSAVTYDPGTTGRFSVIVTEYEEVLYMTRQPGQESGATTTVETPEEHVPTDLPVGITVVTDGDVSDGDITYALHRLEPVVNRIDEPVLFCRVKLAIAADPARPRPAKAQILVDIRGDLVRAQVAGDTLTQAVDLLKDRLRDKLNHRQQRRRALRRRPDISENGTWRHGDLPTPRPAYYDRPLDERQIVRRKAFSIESLAPDEAIFDMEQLDHSFYLFNDLASGLDAMVEQLDDGTYRLTRLEPVEVDPGPVAAPIEISPVIPPRLDPLAAAHRLETTEDRQLFFVDPDTGRGCIIYHRYDGHYGLITPQ